MLRHACRVASLYMQIILRWFSPGFESYDYKAMQGATGKEFDRFIKKCSLAYVLDLHLKGDFVSARQSQVDVGRIGCADGGSRVLLGITSTPASTMPIRRRLLLSGRL